MIKLLCCLIWNMKLFSTSIWILKERDISLNNNICRYISIFTFALRAPVYPRVRPLAYTSSLLAVTAPWARVRTFRRAYNKVGPAKRANVIRVSRRVTRCVTSSRRNCTSARLYAKKAREKEEKAQGRILYTPSRERQLERKNKEPCAGVTHASCYCACIVLWIREAISWLGVLPGR